MTGWDQKYTLYGLNNYTDIIMSIIHELSAEEYEFDIKLILTEGIANAFYHGNHGNEALPIYIRYNLHDRMVIFEIEDCGKKKEPFVIPDVMDDAALFQESNRGIFLMGCYADKVEFQTGKLRIEKKLQAIL